MPDFKTHSKAGAIFGLGAYALVKLTRGEDWTWEGAIGSALCGLFTASLPDILEPAHHPNHRAAAHSVAALLGTSYAAYCVHKSDKIDGKAKLMVSVATAGYLSHLMLDSQTPKGLPLFARCP